MCTIHQPSREVFEAFDNLLLLRKGGICVYNGAISNLDSYLRSTSSFYALPADLNPADHVLEVFCGPLGAKEDWGRLYRMSGMDTDTLADHTSCSCDSCSSGKIAVDLSPRSMKAELWSVFQRQILVNWRTPSYMAVRLWWTVAANLLVGVVYLGAAVPSPSGATNIIGSLFFYVNIATVPLRKSVVVDYCFACSSPISTFNTFNLLQLLHRYHLSQKERCTIEKQHQEHTEDSYMAWLFSLPKSPITWVQLCFPL